MVSPYSIQHDWHLHWTRLPSNLKEPNYINDESPKECAALDAIAKVGIIGGEQLFRLFNLGKKRLRNMVREQKLVRHELRKGKQPIPIYTLGKAGAKITSFPQYEPNDWVRFQTKDVLQMLMFFELYAFFPEAQVVPAAHPFVGAIQFKGKVFYVYVIREDTKDIQLFLKWKQHAVPQRVIMVTESWKHVAFCSNYAETTKIRITTDQELQNKHHDMSQLFYFFDKHGNVVKEV
ncbi:hypothetical protein [Lentibacillus cibarius]|uniref:Uncharacterized protein n=1 Tax=Lentibacillus cibarius TaxID=2583219 RepID=A0A5S3QFY6_9BACI|nr:hypothetical protein [Lentibacillus cibarius]TMN20844.1 hypothetical protein FFL34_00995 [Lentibacillus cibarius]